MKNILVIIIVLYSHNYFSQIKVFTDQTLRPTVSSEYFGKSSQNSTVDNKGRINKSIGIANLKSGDLAYNLNISYSSNGLKLNDWGGALGLLWQPEFTSLIYREIRGLPDDYSQKVNYLGDFNLNEYHTLHDMYEAKINNNTAGKDGECDVFYYNVNDLRGSFIIKDHQAYLLNYSEKVKIEIGTDLSSFTITDIRGVKYYYGQGNNIEYSSFSSYCDPGSSPQSSSKTAWFLTKIEDVNVSKSITFIYDTVTGNYPENYSESKNIKKGIYSGDVPVGNGQNVPQYESFIEDGFCVTIKDFSTRYIKKIQSSDFSVDFFYNNRMDISGKFCDRIEIKNTNGILVNKIKFNYLQAGNYLQAPDMPELGTATPVRYFLQNIKVGINQDEVYNFEYNNLSLLPPRFSKGQDFVGIYNGRINTSLLPKEYINNMLDLINGGYPNPLTINSFSSGFRFSQYPYSSYGLLNRIIYPTKGIEEIFYEPNMVLKDSDTIESEFYGVRPYKIELSDLTGNKITKKYVYKNTEIDPSTNQLQFGISSAFYSEDDSFGGYLTEGYNSGFYPCNTGPAAGTPCPYIYKFYKINSDKRYNINAFQGSFIAYRSVTEITNNTRFETKKYNVKEDLPAQPMLGYSNSYLPFYSNDWNVNLINTKIEGEVKTGNYNIKRLTDYAYTFSDILNVENYVVSRDYLPLFWNMDQYYSSNLEAYSVYKYNLTSRWFNNAGQKETLVLDGGRKIVTNTTNEYFNADNYNNLKSVKRTFSDGSTDLVQYQYAKDLYQTGDLVQRNIVGIPIITTNYHNSTPVAKSKLSFSRDWLGHEYLFPQKQESMVLSLINTPNEYYDTEINYDQYDTKGNLLQFTSKDGVPVTLIYGYNQTLPILKVQGITYVGLMNILGLGSNLTGYNNLDICQKSNADIDVASEQLLLNSLDLVRSNAALSGYQITTYTYDPLIGVRSITPPSGIREVYLYDTANRLMEIREGNQTGKLLKEFKYNYKTNN